VSLGLTHCQLIPLIQIQMVKPMHPAGAPSSVNVYGRKVKIPWAVDKVARFTFADLCEEALGTADYITIASNFETIIIDETPYMYLRHKNQARRLINLVDALCESEHGAMLGL
jgi:protein AFG1